MSELVGTVCGTGSCTVRAAAVSSRPTAEPVPSETGITAAPLSPRMMADPVAGVMIAQYISSEGEMTMQFPSSTVVAYLRSGLSEVGLPVRDETPSVHQEV